MLMLACLASAQRDPGGTPVEGVKSYNTKKAPKQEPPAPTVETFGAQSYDATGTSAEVGVTEGQLSVSLSGGATYSVPIATPPGINGVVPQVSLVYNSQGGNGLAGFGWNVSGVSVITRVPSTKFHDGSIDAVDYDALDRFAFDGQRLMVKDGTSGVYGADGTVYQTESFSNVQITSYGTHPNGAAYGPAYFVVQYPDGSLAHYGNSSTSRSRTDWAITFWQNPQGVRISYEYTLSNNNLAITAIKYGARTTATPINEIRFLYKPRTRSEQAYIGGESFIRSNVISEIRVLGNGVGFRNYVLAHQANSLGYDRLVKITEKTGDNSLAFNPTVFTYDDTTNTDLFQISNAIAVNDGFTSLSGISYVSSGSINGDFDGDGKMDVILYPITGANANGKYYLLNSIDDSGLMISEHTIGFRDIFPTSWLSWNEKLMPMQGWCVVQHINGTNTTHFKNYSTGTVSPIYWQYDKSYQFPKFTYGYMQTPCGGGTGPQPYDPRIIQPEDPSLQPGNPGNLQPENPGPGEPVYVEIVKDIPKVYLNGDFNGDGLSDVLVVEKSVSYSYTNYCTTTTQTYSGGKTFFVDLDRRLTANYVNVAGYMQTTANSKFTVADIDGNGKTDVVVTDAGVVRVYLLTDNKTLQLMFSLSDGSILADKPSYWGDFNGDGKSDFLIPQANNADSWSFFYSKGNTFQKLTTAIGLEYRIANGGYYGVVGFNINTYSLNEHSYVVNDFNGDGKSDILYQQNLTVEYVMTRGGADYTNYGDPQITYLVLLENMNVGPTSANFNIVTTNAQFGGIRRNPLPVFLDHNSPNRALEYALLSGNNIRTFKSTKDSRQDMRLKRVVIGNGVTSDITYAPLQTQCDVPYNCNVPYADSGYTENYPNFDIVNSPGFQVVSRIEENTGTQYRKQEFKYYGAVTNLEGMGFLGFRGLARTNWFNTTMPVVTTITKHDLTQRGAIAESWSIPGQTNGNFTSYIPTNFITKSVMTYSSQLLGNKVFKIANTGSLATNGLLGTSEEVTATFDVYNNPLTVTTVTKNGSTTERTETVTREYFDQPLGSAYYIGRPKRKATSTTVPGNTMTAEELYTYNASQLLSKVRKKGHQTNYLTEDNTYDVNGNVVQKVLTATGLPTRTTSYTYDSTGRFLLTSTDMEGMVTTYTYNTANGLLLTETTPSLPGYPLTNSYEYDKWGKKTKSTDYLGNQTTYSYNISGISQASHQAQVSGADGSMSIQYFDKKGRRVAEGYRTINNSGDPGGNISWKTYQFDIHDRVVKAYEPSISTNPAWSGLSASTSFDVYGRTVSTVNPMGVTTTVSYNGLSATESNGTLTVSRTNNALGQLVSMTDNGGTITYEYFANGNLKRTSFNGVNVTLQQDGWGRKTQMTDPASGTFAYEYNEWGETTKETTPKGIITFVLDGFGKLLEKTVQGTGNDLTNTKTTYTYNPTTKLLTGMRYDDFQTGVFTNYSYGYDNYKRLNFSDESGFNAYYQRAVQFDNLGRPEKELFTGVNTTDMKRSDKWVRYVYKNGFKYQIVDDATNAVLWTSNKVTAKGKLASATYGNGISITNTYDAYGFPTQFKHDKTTPAVVNVMTLNTYFTPATGNLSSKYNSLFDYQESFTYDNVDRLATWKETGDLLHHFTFTSTTEGFTPVGTASVSVSNGKLQVSASPAPKGVERLVMVNAVPGQKINVKGALNVQASATGTTLRISFYEKDPVTGNMVGNTTLGMPISTGNFSFGTTVSTYSQIYLKFEIHHATPANGFMAFTLDDVKLFLEKNEVQTYDSMGRIDENSQGSYNYTNNASAFQNTSIDLLPASASYYLQRSDLQIDYNVLKSPVNIIEEGKDKLSFLYNANNQRATMYYGGLQNDKLLRPYRKHYSADGTMEIKQQVGGGVEFITFIGGDAYNAPVLLRSDGTTQSYLYLHRDYQGTIVAVTDQSAAIVEKRLFDCWGNITRVEDGQGNVLPGLTVIDRGYTGHEHLQGVALIHMNARLYDPMTHRFLQPDPVVKDPFSTQAFNRYGYAMNNPTRYVDQGGEFFWAAVVVGAIIGAAAGAAGYIASAIVTGNWDWGQFGISVLTGAIVGGISGGIAQQACTVTLSAIGNAAASSFVAGFFPPINMQMGDWSFSFSPAIAFGNASGMGVNFSVSYNAGDWNFSGGIGLMSNGNYNGFGANQQEIRYSVLAAYNDGKTGFSYGTNFWRGDFRQRTGVVGFNSGDVRLMYENDGSIGPGGDGGDSYRTAALNVYINDYSFGFNLFTGYRNYDGENGAVSKHRDPMCIDDYGRRMPHGLALEEGPKYRLGALTVGYKGYRVGVNSEHVRHAIQDQAIHNLNAKIPNPFYYLTLTLWDKKYFDFDKRQMGFENQSWNWNGYVQYRTPNMFTSWQ